MSKSASKQLDEKRRSEILAEFKKISHYLTTPQKTRLFDETFMDKATEKPLISKASFSEILRGKSMGIHNIPLCEILLIRAREEAKVVQDLLENDTEDKPTAAKADIAKMRKRFEQIYPNLTRPQKTHMLNCLYPPGSDKPIISRKQFDRILEGGSFEEEDLVVASALLVSAEQFAKETKLSVGKLTGVAA